MKNPIITIKDVVKVFRVKAESVIVLKKVSVDIVDCTFTIIFGPSGCGKSTLLHIILGLEKPTSGYFSFFDQDLYTHPEDYRSEFRKSNVGMVYQQPNWIKSLTVIENIAFAGLLVGMNRPKALEESHKVLGLVGMDKWADYAPTELSSGQQQKVSLARALISNPRVIIADEPTGNLDYQSGVDLMKLFDKLVKEGKTIIMVTHDVNIIDHADQVIQMFDGNIVNKYDMKRVDLKATKQALIDQEFTARPTDTSSLARTLPTFTTKPTRSQRFKEVIKSIRELPSGFLQIISFIGTLVLYCTRAFIENLAGWRLMPHFLTDFLSNLTRKMMMIRAAPHNMSEIPSITTIDLIDLSMKNMFSKKTRTVITISGMTLGIGLIVFLVSIGYGLEKLVISRVARLEETKQIDAIPAVASNVKINDKSLASFKNIEGIKKVLPVIGVVGKVNYKNSKTDVALYGVMPDYLIESANKPVYGRIFTSKLKTQAKPLENTLALENEPEQQGEVAGTSIAKGHKIGDKITGAKFTMTKGKVARVRIGPTTSSDLLGQTSLNGITLDGTLVIGGAYIGAKESDMFVDGVSGKPLALWVRANYPLSTEVPCKVEELSESDKPKCVDGYIISPKLDYKGKQVYESGYIATLSVKILEEYEPDSGALTGDSEVLGISDENGLAASAEADMDTDASNSLLTRDEMKDLLPPSEEEKTKVVKISAENTTREAIINKSLARVLGFSSVQEAIGKKLIVSFEVTGELAGSDKKIVSSDLEYTVVGATDETSSPMLYVPIGDVKMLGLQNYSQVKLVAASQEVLQSARQKVESLGFKTSSVVDTIAQIEQLFASVRTVLGLLGVVALSVAALGMFNTLTVSLLERTHEIGMMKAIGMKSTEVKDLFLTESMIMGFLGGIGGLLMGYLGGRFVSLILTAFAILKGEGTIDIAYIPPTFILLIVCLSLFVGIATGLYPAWRATKISALDALRYE